MPDTYEKQLIKLNRRLEKAIKLCFWAEVAHWRVEIKKLKEEQSNAQK